MLALPVSLSLLVGLLLIAFGVAGYAWIANHRRQELVGRTMTGTDFARARRSSALLTADGQKAESVQARLLRKFPSLKIEDSKYAEKLTHAGGTLMLSGANEQVKRMLERGGLLAAIGPEHLYWSADQAIVAAEKVDCRHCAAEVGPPEAPIRP